MHQRSETEDTTMPPFQRPLKPILFALAKALVLFTAWRGMISLLGHYFPDHNTLVHAGALLICAGPLVYWVLAPLLRSLGIEDTDRESTK